MYMVRRDFLVVAWTIVFLLTLSQDWILVYIVQLLYFVDLDMFVFVVGTIFGSQGMKRSVFCHVYGQKRLSGCCVDNRIFADPISRLDFGVYCLAALFCRFGHVCVCIRYVFQFTEHEKKCLLPCVWSEETFWLLC